MNRAGIKCGRRFRERGGGCEALAENYGIQLLNGKVIYFSKRGHAYKAYIRSTIWEKLRLARIEIDNGRCRLCNSTCHLEVHHRHYPRILGTETMDDLTTLCHQCHRIVTHSERQRKYLKRTISLQDTKRISPIILKRNQSK